MTDTVFTHAEYDKLLTQTIENVKKLGALKGGEYAGDVDRLANFRRNAEQAETTMEFVWRIYIAKHWDAIMQYEKDLRNGVERERLETLCGRADDMIVYLILFKAMLWERVGSAVVTRDIDYLRAQARGAVKGAAVKDRA